MLSFAKRHQFFLTLLVVFTLLTRLGNITLNVFFKHASAVEYISNDSLHHYHIGIILILSALLLSLKNRPWSVVLAALGLGLCIDEYAQFLSDIHVPLPYTHSSVFDDVTMLISTIIALILLKPWLHTKQMRKSLVELRLR